MLEGAVRQECFPSSGTFAKLRKTTINFVMSVRPSVRMEQLGSHLMEINEILYLITFRKKCRDTSNFIKIAQE